MGARAFLTLSTGLSPMQIDLYGLNEDYVWSAAGIFRVNGDTMQIAFGQGPKNRAKNFQNTKNADGSPLSILRTYRRQPGAPPVRRGPAAPDASLLPWLESTDQ